MRQAGDRIPSYDELVAVVEFLKQQLERLTTRVGELEAENAALKAENGELTAKLGKNSRNSSKPPSTDDSSGMFGHTATELVDAYARLDWRASGLPAAIYWRDLLQILCHLANYAMVPSPESALLRAAGVRQDIALADAVAVELTADYQQARMGWHAEEMGTLRAHLAVAGRGLTAFADLARQLGSHNVTAIRALVDAALKRRSPTTALAVLRAADIPGRHQAWIHRRRTELETEQEP